MIIRVIGIGFQFVVLRLRALLDMGFGRIAVNSRLARMDIAVAVAGGGRMVVGPGRSHNGRGFRRNRR